MNHTIYKDVNKNAIRFSKIANIEAEIPFTGLDVKYVESGLFQGFQTSFRGIPQPDKK